MLKKGDKTKQNIREKAYELFSEKGYKDVTMKDICEQTGLSRGGLYRHYESTEQIFLEIVNDFSDHQKHEISSKIRQHIPAVTILDELLSRYADEMIDCKKSLSLAIYEFYSNPAISKAENSVTKQYEISKAVWTELLIYGITNEEFKPVNPEAMFDIIVFAYQGVRMYSRLMNIDKNVSNRIINEIKELLLRKEVSHE